MIEIDPTASVAPSTVLTEDATLGPGAQQGLDFPGTLYGVPCGTSMREIMRSASAVYDPRA
ncbi:hypothetical protein ACFRFH_05020 [Leifsonia sp. NPDC056824]|uniref:hypothetical protein n=1 Tax=Leifsonia sp. NPDC056824 TaxID=3345953 RepID=UPI0036A1D245